MSPRKMEERYGIPYFEGSFYGIGRHERLLCAISRGCWCEQGAPADLLARTEALIAAEEARAWARLAPYKERLNGKRVLLIHRRRQVLVGGRGAAGSRAWKSSAPASRNRPRKTRSG